MYACMCVYTYIYIYIYLLVGSERAFGCVRVYGKRAFGKRAFANARSRTHCVRTAFG